MNRIDCHLSYNAHRGEDSYSHLRNVLFPLAYKLREYPFFRAEGHIGKKMQKVTQIVTRVNDREVKNIELGTETISFEMKKGSETEKKTIFLSEVKKINDKQINRIKQVRIDRENNSVTIMTGECEIIILAIEEERDANGAVTNTTLKMELILPIEYIKEVKDKYNLCFDILAIDISREKSLNATGEEQYPGCKQFPTLEEFLCSGHFCGMEHISGSYPCQTLVLFYVSEPEQLEFSECNKDEAPEIEPYTIVADFTLPCRLCCCRESTFLGNGG